MQTVHAFLYFFFRALAVKPNVGHITLASLYLPSVSSRVIPSASSPPLHVTQNIDELSLHAVSVLPDPEVVTVAKEHLVQMHGSIFRTRCTSCQHVKHTYEPYLTNSLKDLDKDSSQELTTSTDKLPRCGGDEWAGSNRYGRCGSLLRPDVVWFGEVPPVLGEIARKLTWCDLLLVIGTSALVSRPFNENIVENHGMYRFNLPRALLPKCRSTGARSQCSIWKDRIMMKRPIFCFLGAAILHYPRSLV